MTITTDPDESLTIENLTVRYGSTTVLDGLTLGVRPGEFLTLLGPSGSGKTSLLMAIAGFVDVAGGSIRLGSRDLTAVPPHLREMGLVFQSYALFPHMNVFENVAYPLRLRKYDVKHIRERVCEVLHLMKMESFMARAVDELSGGQRQRVALARAIVFEPAVLLMDEPLSALDRKLREHMQLELRRLHERLGVSTVYVTHDQREALTMSDRIVVMDSGRIAQVDTPQALYERPRTRFVAEFIGTSSFIPITMGGNKAYFGEHEWSMEGSESSPELVVGSSKGLLVLRPESLHLLDSAGGGFNELPATLRSKFYEGDSILLEAEAERDIVLRLRVPASDSARISSPGTALLLGWRPEASIIVAER